MTENITYPHMRVVMKVSETQHDRHHCVFDMSRALLVLLLKPLCFNASDDDSSYKYDTCKIPYGLGTIKNQFHIWIAEGVKRSADLLVRTSQVLKAEQTRFVSLFSKKRLDPIQNPRV